MSDIEHPIFISASIYTPNAFWKSIFKELAFGRTPLGAFISKGYLCCNYKNKEFSYKIDNKADPESAYNDVYYLLSEKLGLLSSDTKVELFNSVRDNLRKTVNVTSWSSIRKKSMKDSMVENYIVSSRVAYGLSLVQAQNVWNLINLGLCVKNLQSCDIVLKNNKIDSIRGISFYPKRVVLNMNVFDIKYQNFLIKPPKRESLSEKWDKFKTDLNKYYFVHQRA